MRILFCTDGSQTSLSAIENVLDFLNPDECRVDSICVIDWNFLPSSVSIDTENISKVYVNIADSVLNFSKKFIEGKGVACESSIKAMGSAAEEILIQLDKVEYDLVVMGSYGKKGIQKWLGSVSRQVVSNTKVPVFVSKKQMKNEKVLIATDGSDASNNAVKRLVNLFDLRDKEIFVVSVKESPEFFPMDAVMDKNWIDSIEKQQNIHATKAINKVKMILDKYKIPVHNEVVLCGNPAQKIIEFSEKEKMDLVVLGARTKSELSKLLVGSVSKRVLDLVDSSILIIN